LVKKIRRGKTMDRFKEKDAGSEIQKSSCEPGKKAQN
jgi:hypothetical protein